jgi:hypothetical protein
VENVLPHDLHLHLCRPSAERPFLVTSGDPHLGQRAGSPGRGARRHLVGDQRPDGLDELALLGDREGARLLQYHVKHVRGPPLRFWCLATRIVVGAPDAYRLA